MAKASKRKAITFSFIFLMVFFPFTTSTETAIKRGTQKGFHRIIWNGDCNRINGVSFVSD